MTTMDIMRFEEEKFTFVENLLKERLMSRVALMRYLVKYKKTFVPEPDPFQNTEELKEEICGMVDEIIDFLAAIDDEDYKRLFIDRQE